MEHKNKKPETKIGKNCVVSSSNAEGYYRSCSGALQLVGRDSGDSCAASTLVRYPVQHILSSVLAVTPQATPEIMTKLK